MNIYLYLEWFEFYLLHILDIAMFCNCDGDASKLIK